MKNIFLITIFITLPFQLIARSGKKAEIEYSYKKKEVFDFGEMTIRGQVITPGDLSIRGGKRKLFRSEFTVRKNFDPEVSSDLHQIGH